jgi:hypothetical protein
MHDIALRVLVTGTFAGTLAILAASCSSTATTKGGGAGRSSGGAPGASGGSGIGGKAGATSASGGMSAGGNGGGGGANRGGTGASGGQSGDAGQAGEGSGRGGRSGADGRGGSGGKAGAGQSGGAGEGGVACTDQDFSASPVTGAFMLVLDRSGSMSDNGKWNGMSTGLLDALDHDLFDQYSIGALFYPQSSVQAPDCACQLVCGACSSSACNGFPVPSVACGVGLPTVAIAPAGSDKSNDPSGPRRSISQYFFAQSPSGGESSPAYAALSASYTALRAESVDRRVVLWITDGSPSCAATANPVRPGFASGDGCDDWEDPASIHALISAARTHATAPSQAFVLGVPGSDSTDQTVGAAPYAMSLALSTLAVAGADELLDPTCDDDLVFSQAAPAPSSPCHVNLATGFSAVRLRLEIEEVARRSLGCVFKTPALPNGVGLDSPRVSVRTTLGSITVELPRRTVGSACDTGAGCWDATTDEIRLVGAACPDVDDITGLDVTVRVACEE